MNFRSCNQCGAWLNNGETVDDWTENLFDFGDGEGLFCSVSCCEKFIEWYYDDEYWEHHKDQIHEVDNDELANMYEEEMEHLYSEDD